MWRANMEELSEGSPTVQILDAYMVIILTIVMFLYRYMFIKTYQVFYS